MRQNTLVHDVEILENPFVVRMFKMLLTTSMQDRKPISAIVVSNLMMGLKTEVEADESYLNLKFRSIVPNKMRVILTKKFFYSIFILYLENIGRFIEWCFKSSHYLNVVRDVFW